jgi:sugar lactone lactonase YvrE
MTRASSLTFLVLSLGCAGPSPAADSGVDAPIVVDAAPFDAGPMTVEVFANVGATTEGIAIGRTLDGVPVLYVGTLDDRIVRIAPDGVVGDFVHIDGPLGIAIRDDGVLVVCAKQPDAMGGAPGIFEVTADGVVSTLVATGPGGVDFGLTNFVAIAPDGSLVFSDSMGNRLFRADADGSNVALVTDTITYPNGLAFSPDGTTLFVASWDTTTLHALSFDAATGAYGAPTAAIENVAHVDGIVTTSTGSLVLVTSSMGVLTVDPEAPTAAPIELASTRAIALPANGTFGDSAFGVNELYLTSLGRQTVFVVHTELTAR